MPYGIKPYRDAALSDFALQYSQAGLWIADKVLPARLTNKKTGEYYKYYLKDILDLPETDLKAPGGQANQIHWDLTTGTYACKKRALKDIVADEDRDDQDNPIDLNYDTTQILTEKLMTAKEKRVADAVFDETTNFVSYTAALTGGDRWDVYSTSDPYANVETARDSVLKNSAKAANTIIMGYDVFRKIRHHPDVLERAKYGGSLKDPTVLNEEELARAFDVSQVLVGRTTYNTAAEGQTVVPGYVWGKYVMVCYIDPKPNKKSVTMGMIVRRTKMQVRTWRDDDREGDWFEPGFSEDEIIVAAGAGYLYSTVVS